MGPPTTDLGAKAETLKAEMLKAGVVASLTPRPSWVEGRRKRHQIGSHLTGHLRGQMDREVLN